ncbi:N-acetylglutamate synthase, GNAT family [Evansella caseinilytica]|uniref:N-acetylglutamate synthase, GNAT family n=1 Tax=Evansella caseinilytica TaxID=1503961 RepID=A0A1H3T7W6_9BACI|nr:hypothetical protein [Evansella caseinilytica]SDZ45429.1 N-acetylglutamate synthase, GNAT family [Evansella caseinilytica]
MSFIVRKASVEDTLPLQHFIVKTGMDKLPAMVDWTSFLIAENNSGEFAAVVRIQQLTDSIGLLRTLIVDSKKITTLFILEFIEASVKYAQERGIYKLYLLAAGESGFLSPLGFTKIAEEYLPAELLEAEDVKGHVKKQLPVFLYDQRPGTY